MERMKVKIGEYEIEVTARRSFGSPDIEYNRIDTGYFLNNIGNAFWEASENYTKANQLDLASDCYKKFMDIHRALDKAGFFDDL